MASWDLQNGGFHLLAHAAINHFCRSDSFTSGMSRAVRSVSNKAVWTTISHATDVIAVFLEHCNGSGLAFQVPDVDVLEITTSYQLIPIEKGQTGYAQAPFADKEVGNFL